MGGTILQANVNHSAAAQDLLCHHMAEWGIDLGIVSEPYRVLPRPDWAGDSDGRIAIVHRGGPHSLPFDILTKGRGFVVVGWGEVVVVGIYQSPNEPLPTLEKLLENVEAAIRPRLAGPVLVAGDLNAKSGAWGSPVTNVFGRTVVEWADEMGLIVLNKGTAPTCVRHNGSSIIDITLGNPRAARMVGEWEVLEGKETLSDHNYIRFCVSDPSEGKAAAAKANRACPQTASNRWVLKKLNVDGLRAAAMIKVWVKNPLGNFRDVDEGAAAFRTAVTEICDMAMPRCRPSPAKPAAYWWTQELAGLRADCCRARRAYVRCRRRRRRDEETEAFLYDEYTDKRKRLQREIRNAKARAWDELVETVEKDPWGRPYKLVRKKLSCGGPPTTERLHPEFLQRVVDTLFPVGKGEVGEVGRPPIPDPVPWSLEEHGVSAGELAGVLRGLRAKRTAPGPDGIPAKALALASAEMGGSVLQLFNKCLETGRFPKIWKNARMVLLPKQGKPEDSPSAYRPICLLDEAGKVFEKILAARLRRHLSRDGPDLADCQFGFREGRSTVDAILHVKTLAVEAVNKGKGVVAVSLDIANAFNSLPWECIRRALIYHKVPSYLRAVIRDYLRDRSITFTGRYGVITSRAIERGVPQGSVLGPLLWNLGYDWVLRGALLPGLSLSCYADDTLVMARERNWERTIQLAEVGVKQVVTRVRNLGLRVALEKTEAIWFGRPRSRGPPRAQMQVDGVAVQINKRLKYLGLILDSGWSFAPHIEGIAPRVSAAANGLARLMPNLGGAGDRVRRLYCAVVQSIALYGAPVWHDEVWAGRRSANVLRAAQGRLAIRAIRGYRTISHGAACAIAGMMPWPLTTALYKEMYRIRCLVRSNRGGDGEGGEEVEDPRDPPDPAALRRELRVRRARLQQQKMDEWKENLANARSGLRAIGAIRPVLDKWVGRKHGSLGYRLVQVLTGHGCFGEYLHRINREEDTRCHHCDSMEDTAQHTLEDCPAWAEERRVLREVVGEDISLPALVEKMLENNEGWRAAVSFCEIVMSRKEIAEREREGDRGAPDRRRRRGGAARATYDRHAAP